MAFGQGVVVLSCKHQWHESFVVLKGVWLSSYLRDPRLTRGIQCQAGIKLTTIEVTATCKQRS